MNLEEMIQHLYIAESIMTEMRSVVSAEQSVNYGFAVESLADAIGFFERLAESLPAPAVKPDIDIKKILDDAPDVLKPPYRVGDPPWTLPYPYPYPRVTWGTDTSTITDQNTKST